ncbi:hypothetical protein [Streptomyces sp. NPDC058157]|uniref:terpene synthase family protein n=1 Tax=Streptomyces sp. NPDC058157 TaxID=3346360 RepID=UPI0036E90826
MSTDARTTALPGDIPTHTTMPEPIAVDDIPRFAGVPHKVHPGLREIEETAVAWALEHRVIAASDESADDWRSQLAGGCAAYVYPESTVELAALWGRWYIWWFTVDELAIKYSMRDFVELVCRWDAPLKTGGQTLEGTHPMVRAFADLCRRTAELIDPDTYAVLAQGCIEAFEGFLIEMAFRDSGDVLKLEGLEPNGEYLVNHRRTFGAVYDYSIYEACRGYPLPSMLRRTPEWQGLLTAGMDVIILQNDLNGLARDIRGNDLKNNSVCLLHLQEGLSYPEAVETVKKAIRRRIQDFLSIENRLPEFARKHGLGPAERERFAALVRDLKQYSQGGLDWYRETSRYDTTHPHTR